MRRGAAGLIVLVLLLSACTVPGRDSEQCGTWQTTITDPRVAVAPVAGPADAHCAGTFLLTGNTQALGIIGGYTLELKMDHATRLRPLEWSSIPANHPQQLLPGRSSTLRLIPSGGSADVTLLGTMTSNSLRTDTALFLIKTALDELALGTCIIPPELILGTATDTSGTLASVGDALAAGNAADAGDKVRTLSESFFTQAGDYLKSRAPQCAARTVVKMVELVTGFSATTFFFKLLENFGVWAASVIQDGARYRGKPVSVTMKYTPASERNNDLASRWLIRQEERTHAPVLHPRY